MAPEGGVAVILSLKKPHNNKRWQVTGQPTFKLLPKGFKTTHVTQADNEQASPGALKPINNCSLQPEISLISSSKTLDIKISKQQLVKPANTEKLDTDIHFRSSYNLMFQTTVAHQLTHKHRLCPNSSYSLLDLFPQSSLATAGI